MTAAFSNALVDPDKAKAISAGTESGELFHPEVVEVRSEVKNYIPSDGNVIPIPLFWYEMLRSAQHYILETYLPFQNYSDGLIFRCLANRR